MKYSNIEYFSNSKSTNAPIMMYSIIFKSLLNVVYNYLMIRLHFQLRKNAHMNKELIDIRNTQFNKAMLILTQQIIVCVFSLFPSIEIYYMLYHIEDIVD